MAVTEYDGEPVPGLPQRLPEGERIVWQGAPDWKRLAITAYHVRKVAIYFGLLLVAALAAGSTVGMGMTIAAGVSAVAILSAMAWLTARSTLFTITSRRVVMRFGVAVPMCIQVPMKQVATARLNARPDGSGDIALAIVAGDRAGYFILWPYVRPWKFASPEPMLRALPDAARVADLLARTMAEAVPEGRRVPVGPKVASAKAEPLKGALAS
ncbi:MAG: photosynthetic complex putative assembly protein PuhB [Sphingomonadaceae bacterium]